MKSWGEAMLNCWCAAPVIRDASSMRPRVDSWRHLDDLANYIDKDFREEMKGTPRHMEGCCRSISAHVQEAQDLQ